VGSETAPLFLVAADLTVLHVDANVRKNDIGEVNLGDKATFTVGPFANRLFAGEVTQIGPSPQTIENVVTYDVVITASNPDLLVQPGMTATIRIVVDRRDNVLRAPDQALRYSPAGHAAPSDSTGARTPLAGWPQVWTLREGRPTAVPVQLGLQDGVYTEIVKGDLKPGDDLIISESSSRVNQ
jgi:HlyD family secretion protein